MVNVFPHQYFPNAATINNLAFGRSVDETKRVLQVCVPSLFETRPSLTMRTKPAPLSSPTCCLTSCCVGHPIRPGQPRRGLPSGLEARRQDHEPHTFQVQGLLQGHLRASRRQAAGDKEGKWVRLWQSDRKEILCQAQYWVLLNYWSGIRSRQKSQPDNIFCHFFVILLP